MTHKPNGPLGKTVEKLKEEIDKASPDPVEITRRYRTAMRMVGKVQAMKDILGDVYWKKVQPYVTGARAVSVGS